MTFVAAALAACEIFSGCSFSGADAEAQAPDGGAGARAVVVSAATVERRDVPIFLDGLGTVVALRTVAVHTQVDGQLLEVAFREGQPVERGQLLARIDPRPFNAQLHQAEGALARDLALLEDAKLNLRRFSNLRKRHLVAQENVDDQRALVGQYQGAVRMDRAQIETAKLNLKYSRITSPVDGLAGIRLIDPGNVVHAADANGIVVVTQLDPIAVLITQPQDDLPEVARELKHGPLPVAFFQRDGERQIAAGQVSVIDNQINQSTATIRLKAIVPNAGERLWPNQFVKSHLRVTTRKGAIVVPATAIQRGPDGNFAYVIGADMTVSARPVRLESTMGDWSIVLAGLQPGERVVTEGHAQLGAGARVTIRTSAGANPDGGAVPIHFDGGVPNNPDGAAPNNSAGDGGATP